MAIVVAAALGRDIVSSPSPEPRRAPVVRQGRSAAGQAGSVRARRDVVRFRDGAASVSIAYPATWARVRPSDPEVRLLVAADDSTSLLMRVAPIGLEAQVTPGTLPLVRPLTDRLVGAGERVRLLAAPRTVVLGGLPGYRYRYTFSSVGGHRGAHLHYFLFKEKRMIQLVFQALPSDRLPELSGVFERIAATFRGTA